MAGETNTAPTTIRVLDYETTGTPEDEAAEVTEIGAVDLDPDTFGIRREWSTLVMPKGKIPPQARAVHHIGPNDLAGAPAFRDVIDEALGGADILAAHNARFEQHFTPYKDQPWICTYKCARVVWSDAPGHGNQVLRYWLGIDGNAGFDAGRAMPPHRALPDAYVTAFILAQLLRLKSVDELVTISKYPVLLKVMTFGKHKGMTYEDAPADYLMWTRDKSEMDEDTKFSAKYWLRKRGL